MVLGIALLCFPFVLGAQNRSVVCHKPEWDKVFEQARKEGKPVFVDCGATWCGPCKKFKTEVLGNDTVADFFNAHFITVYLDVDKDKFPEVEHLPALSSVPVLFFVDAEKMETMYAYIGAPGVSEFMRMGKLVLEGKYTLDNMREQFQAGTMTPSEMLAFLQTLSMGRYGEEYGKVLPHYMAALNIDSLKSEEVWAFCEKEMNDMQLPLFREAWAKRQLLGSWHGKERVMDKFAKVFNRNMNIILAWKKEPYHSDDARLTEMASYVLEKDMPEREYYSNAVSLEQAAREGDFAKVGSQLRGVVKDNLSDKRKKDLVKNFVTKIVNNVPQEEWEPYIKFVDKTAKRMADLGAKSELYYFESDLWKKIGNEKESDRAYRLGVVTINPDFYKNR